MSVVFGLVFFLQLILADSSPVWATLIKMVWGKIIVFVESFAIFVQNMRREARFYWLVAIKLKVKWKVLPFPELLYQYHNGQRRCTYFKCCIFNSVSFFFGFVLSVQPVFLSCSLVCDVYMNYRKNYMFCCCCGCCCSTIQTCVDMLLNFRVSRTNRNE